MYDYGPSFHLLGALFLYLVLSGLFGWVPSAIGDWWRRRHRDSTH